MKERALILEFALLASLAFAESAQAAPLTFISSAGNDANTCSISAPCRTFAGASVKTNTGGEITSIDSAHYGVILIDKSLTIHGAPDADDSWYQFWLNKLN